VETLIIERSYFKDATMGLMYVKGRDNPVWNTIERPDLNNQPFESCIPEGEYVVKPYSSDKYPDVWEVQNVKNRSKILFHHGNWALDVKGCIAVGLGCGYMHLNGNPEKAVYSSKNAIRQIKDVIGYPSNFKLIIKGKNYV